MKAAYLTKIKTIAVEDIPMHRLANGEMLMKMGATSICGTDIRIYNNGHFKLAENQKRVLGHELTGEIVDLAPGVKGFRKGMRVAMAPNIGCGVCDQCVQGMNNMCPTYDAFGISVDGGFQEYVVIPEAAIRNGNLVEIPDSLSYEEAALAEPLSCVYNSYNRLLTRPGDSVAVIGAGPVGAMHVALHRMSGGAKIIAADLSASRLELMPLFGADVVVDSSKEDLEEAVMRHTGGKGADVVIVAASVPALQQVALRVAGRNGRINYFGGLPSGKDKVELATNLIHYKQLCLYATTGSTYMDHRRSVSLIASGRIDVKPLISKRFAVAETAAAFTYAISGLGMKTFVVGDLAAAS